MKPVLIHSHSSSHSHRLLLPPMLNLIFFGEDLSLHRMTIGKMRHPVQASIVQTLNRLIKQEILVENSVIYTFFFRSICGFNKKRKDAERSHHYKHRMVLYYFDDHISRIKNPYFTL